MSERAGPKYDRSQIFTAQMLGLKSSQIRDSRVPPVPRPVLAFLSMVSKKEDVKEDSYTNNLSKSPATGKLTPQTAGSKSTDRPSKSARPPSPPHPLPSGSHEAMGASNHRWELGLRFPLALRRREHQASASRPRPRCAFAPPLPSLIRRREIGLRIPVNLPRVSTKYMNMCIIPLQKNHNNRFSYYVARCTVQRYSK